MSALDLLLDTAVEGFGHAADYDIICFFIVDIKGHLQPAGKPRIGP